MKITPQIVLESIERDRNTNAFRPGPILSAIEPIFDQAVLFSFPQIDLIELEAHCEFAVDLYVRGLFRLPFPFTALAFERDLGPPHGRRGGMMILGHHPTGEVMAITCSEVDDQHKVTSAVPIALMDKATFEKDGEHGVKIWESHTVPIVSDVIVRAMYGPGEAGINRMRQRMANNVVNAMGLVVLLMSKGVSTQHVPAPERLNRAREKKGKPLHRDRYVVSIDAAHMRTIYNADGSTDDITGHTRGSPRLHWRRGHYRTLNRGEDGERVIPVAPALIGANEQASDIKAKAYNVRTA